MCIRDSTHTHKQTHTHTHTAPAIIDPGENTTTTVPEDGLDYFQTECSAFSDTVLVELTDINGTNFLYCSATETNPGPLTENTIRNDTIGLMRRTCILPLPAGSKVTTFLEGRMYPTCTLLYC